MSTRRGFLALVGGTMFTGTVGHSMAGQPPTLLLPTRNIVKAADVPSPINGRSAMQEAALGLIGAQPSGLADYPLLAAEETQMHAFLTVASDLPKVLFLDWLEGGLRMVEGCKPGGQISRAMAIDLAAGRDPWRRA